MSGLTNPLTGEQIADSEIEGLAELVTQQLSLEDRIANGEALLKKLKGELEVLSTKTIPDKMDQLGMRSLTLTNGRRVEIKPFYSCKVLSPDAYVWLDKHGHGGIIKTTVERKFSRDQRKEAVEFAHDHPEFSLVESIHHQTLTAFTKEIYTKNESLPEELFSVYQGSRTKLS